jgi:cell division transport system permease protein
MTTSSMRTFNSAEASSTVALKKNSCFSQYIIAHWRALQSAFQHIRLYPFSSILTILAIGLTLSFPTLLYLLLHDAENLTKRWQEGTQITLFLSQNASEIDKRDLVEHLKRLPSIANVKYISAEEGLTQFREKTSLDDVLANLPRNPLPAVVEIHPRATAQTPQAIKKLAAEIEHLPYIERLNIDKLWVERIYQLMNFFKSMTYTLEGITLLGVSLVLGVMIRLAVSQHRHDLKVLKLISASPAYMRRPFLYTGILYSIGGGIIAGAMINLAIDQMNGPITVLANSYQSQFRLSLLDLSEMGLLLLFCGFLGWGCARLATFWFMKDLKT